MKMYSSASGILVISIIGQIYCITIHQFPELQQHHEPLHQHHTTPPIPILKQEFQQSKEGYKFSFETANGIHAHEHGFLKNAGDKKHESLVQHGSVTYHDEHGHPITLTYTADEHGFHPQGAHLPTPPPIPEELQKSIDLHHQQFAAQAHQAQLHPNYGGEGFGQEALHE
ncbi:endocuticle structural glycoprotein SgAbd-8-like [Photinus pyralis]|nr:endocuticle structural glycoprotein SgAbd-8-like [Photinus pyralis]